MKRKTNKKLKIEEIFILAADRYMIPYPPL
jgi:hypothetical protein